ncbi:hypothetical protein HHI36_017294 [Cryptolaemus montrouzieri]|uniref:Uncharacterized protein n=1 Tax=Cryptolaemus montrouzieri TaxID=559131 RepID=A0ABD2NM44_9CUCU
MKCTLFILHIFYITFVTNSPNYNWENNTNNTQFIDLTNQCVNYSQQDIFIPIKVGVADAVALFISKKSPEEVPRCSIYFHIAMENHRDLQIIVIEFLDNIHTFEEIIDHCLGKNRIGFLTLKEVDPAGKIIHVCNRFQSTKAKVPLFVHVGFAKTIQVQIDAEDDFHSMKITTTAGRALARHEYCNGTFEIQCTIERNTICINKALSCDKNINCGVFDENDEDYKICRVSRFAYLWVVVLAGLVTLILIFVILVYLLKTYIPAITDNFFIFNEDEDNKLVIKSQLKSHVWQKLKKQVKDPPCFCQTSSETGYSMNSD